MTVLSGAAIERALGTGEIKVQPYSYDCLQPASLDLRLGRRYLQLEDGAELDYRKDNSENFDPRFISDFLVLPPGVFILGETMECVTMERTLSAYISARSSAGRLGILVQTAGVVDPGWHGVLTLELINLTKGPVKLYVGDRIAQLTFHRVDEPGNMYYGKYQGAEEPQASRSYQDGKSMYNTWATLNQFRK